ncbi:hypothetical protein AB0M38_16145 [Streptomyces sp. NPDC051742]|uniref:hypothetical protein n=1 Tax=unclassified Streptomyces TaxID=2593676 RepID=UPI003435AC1B
MTDTNEPRPHVQNTWNVTVHGGAPQMGQGNVQHNTFGYDPRQLAAFADEVLAAARSAELSPQDRTAVLMDAEALRTELASGEPDPGRVRSLTQRVWQGARTYLPPVLATGAAQAVAGFLGVPIGF